MLPYPHIVLSLETDVVYVVFIYRGGKYLGNLNSGDFVGHVALMTQSRHAGILSYHLLHTTYCTYTLLVCMY